MCNIAAQQRFLGYVHITKKVKVSNDQETEQKERKSHSNPEVGKIKLHVSQVFNTKRIYLEKIEV